MGVALKYPVKVTNYVCVYICCIAGLIYGTVVLTHMLESGYTLDLVNETPSGIGIFKVSQSIPICCQFENRSAELKGIC